MVHNDRMNIRDGVWSSVREGMDKLREYAIYGQDKICDFRQYMTKAKCRSLKDVILGREEASIILKCMISLFTCLSVALISLASIYCYNHEDLITNQMPSPPGPITRYNIDVFEPRVDLWWTASTGFVEKYEVVLKDCEAEVVAEVVTEETELSIPFPIINNKISPAFNVEIYSLAYDVHSKPQTERVHVEDYYLIIRKLHATQEDSKSVRLSWKHPFYRLVDSYEVQWADEHSDQYTAMAVDSETTSVIIPDLNPDKTYKFRMASVLPKACRLEGNFLSKDITFKLGPSKPGNVDQIASTITSTSFDLHWKASDILVDHYIVKISGDSSFRAEYKTEDQTPSVRIESLEVNTLYQLDIYAVRGNMKSEARTEVLKTKNIQVHWRCMMTAIMAGGFAAVGVSAFAPVLGAFGFGGAGI